MRKKILLAGATGYLGRYIAHQLISEEFPTRLIVRDKSRVNFEENKVELNEDQVTNTESIEGLLKDIEVVISTVGITRQKDGLTYMDVDYQANVNLINEAKKSGVKKFIYVSVFNGEKLRNLKICEAKEKLVDYLKSSGLEYSIIRPNGFFSDMGDFLKMAKGGKVYLFGDEKPKLNPIHGEDLAKVCADVIDSGDKEINVGGPQVFSQNQIAELALNAYSKKIKIDHLPDWIRKLTIWSLKTFTSSKAYGPFEFFLTTMKMEMVSPKFGHHQLEDFFNLKAMKK